MALLGRATLAHGYAHAARTRAHATRSHAHRTTPPPVHHAASLFVLTGLGALTMYLGFAFANYTWLFDKRKSPHPCALPPYHLHAARRRAARQQTWTRSRVARAVFFCLIQKSPLLRVSSGVQCAAFEPRRRAPIGPSTYLRAA